MALATVGSLKMLQTNVIRRNSYDLMVICSACIHCYKYCNRPSALTSGSDKLVYDYTKVMKTYCGCIMTLFVISLLIIARSVATNYSWMRLRSVSTNNNGDLKLQVPSRPRFTPS